MGEPSTEDAKRWAQSEKEWHLKFLRSPKEFIAGQSGKSVNGVKLAVNKLEVTSMVSNNTPNTVPQSLQIQVLCINVSVML